MIIFQRGEMPRSGPRAAATTLLRGFLLSSTLQCFLLRKYLTRSAQSYAKFSITQLTGEPRQMRKEAAEAVMQISAARAAQDRDVPGKLRKRAFSAP